MSNKLSRRLDVTEEPVKPERLELPIHRSSPWPYLLLGALLGAGIEMLVSLPLDAVFRNLFEYLFAGNPIRLTHALAHLVKPGEWPAVSLTGFILGAALGLVFYRLRENQKRLHRLHQEFEIQVATLRHHYKNLALGISGFSGRARRKLEKLQPQLHDCAVPDADIKVDIDALEQSLTILAEASQRLSHTLTEELKCLKALQSNELTPASQDFFPVLRHAIQDLLELRFREKQIRVEINGQPLTEPCTPLVFAFEPYTMEVILQNILSNAMRVGDFIQIRVAERHGRVRVEILDNGPGFDREEIKRNLVSSQGHRDAESSHLGLRVTLYLLEKCGGHLSALSIPDTGATFILDFPLQPQVPR
jgi:signal transduction histidine kinase